MNSKSQKGPIIKVNMSDLEILIFSYHRWCHTKRERNKNQSTTIWWGPVLGPLNLLFHLLLLFLVKPLGNYYSPVQKDKEKTLNWFSNYFLSTCDSPRALPTASRIKMNVRDQWKTHKLELAKRSCSHFQSNGQDDVRSEREREKE